MKDIRRARGREAHPGRLCRVGQSWKQVTKLACVCDKSSKFYKKVIKVDTDKQFRCPDCGLMVVFDEVENAFCKCVIWNDQAETIRRRFEIMTAHRIGNFFKKCSY